jgi:hypothetical protein
VTATIGIGPRSEGGFGITAALDVFLPDVTDAHAVSRGNSRDLPVFERDQDRRGYQDSDTLLT